MDIKKIAAEAVEKIQANPKLLEQFNSEPVKVLESLIGIDLPDAEVMKLVELIRAKLSLDKVGNLLGGLFKK